MTCIGHVGASEGREYSDLEKSTLEGKQEPEIKEEN